MQMSCARKEDGEFKELKTVTRKQYFWSRGSQEEHETR